MNAELIILIVVLGIAALPFVAMLAAEGRNDGMDLGHKIGKGFAIAPNGAGTVFKRTGAALRAVAGSDAQEMTRDESVTLAFIAPIVCCLMFFTLVIGEGALLNLAWASAHHELPIPLIAGRSSLFATIATLAAATFWGFLALDAQVGRVAGPWRDLPYARRAFLSKMAWAFAIVAIAAGTAFAGWREWMIESGADGNHEGLRTLTGVVIVVVLGAVIGAAALFNLWAVFDTLKIVAMAVLSVIGWMCGFAEHGCRRAIEAIDSAHAFCVAAFDWIIAGRGRRLFNWLVGFDGIGGRLHLTPIVFEERPRILPDF